MASILDFTADDYPGGETGDNSQLIIYEQENYKDEPTTTQVGRVADPGNSTPADRPGIYKYQVALNPNTDVAVRPNFIENPALSGNLTAKEGILGRQEILGTLYLPLTHVGLGPYIRNILQSRGWSATPAADDTIVRTPATPVGKLGTTPIASIALYSATQPRDATAISSLTGTAPASLVLTVETAVAATGDIASGYQAGLVRLTGIDHWDNELTDNFVIPAGTAANTTFKSGKYWKNITTYETEGFDSNFAGTFKVEAFDESQLITFKPYDLEMVSYLLTGLNKGRSPNKYRSGYARNARISVQGVDQLAELQMDIGGRKAHLYENFAGLKVPQKSVSEITVSGASGYNVGDTPTVTITSPNPLPPGVSNIEATATATAVATAADKLAITITHRGIGYTSAPTVTIAGAATATATISDDYDYDYRIASPLPTGVEVIGGPVMDTNRTTLEIGNTGIRLAIINLNFDFGLNFDQSATISGDPDETPIPIRRRRNPIMSGEYAYSIGANYSVNALNNIKEDFLILTFPAKGLGAFPTYHEITIRKTQFQESGDAAIVEGEMRARYSMLGLPSDAGVSDDITWKMFVPKYQDVRNYAA